LQRVRRGLYIVVPLEAAANQQATAEDPWVIARELYSPCYIGGWSAAEHWGLTEQIFRSTLVVTAAAARRANDTVVGHPFRLYRSPRAEFSAGMKSIWRGAERVLVSGPERTLLDGLHAPELCGGGRHLVQWLQAYGESRGRDFDVLVSVAKVTASGAAWKRLGYVAEQLWPAETGVVDTARKHLSTGNARLDPSVRRRGRLVTRWRLWVNVELDQLGDKAQPR
jgi:predicted transcriptional regulator of viral defense system